MTIAMREDAGAALRLASAMRERSAAASALEEARLAFESAQARFDEAEVEVGSLHSSVTFEELLGLVASLTERVAELERTVATGGLVDAGAHGGHGLAPEAERRAVFQGAHLARPRDGDQPLTEAAPAQQAAPHLGPPGGTTVPVEAAPPPLAPAGAHDAGGQYDDESVDGRRPPNRSLLFMEAYDKGFSEGEDGKPTSLSATRGWAKKGYETGRADALGGLEYDPLNAYLQEMRSFQPREPLSPGQRQEASKIAARLAGGRADRKMTSAKRSVAVPSEAALGVPTDGPTPADPDGRPSDGASDDEVDPWDAAAPSGGSSPSEVDLEDDDADVERPAFLAIKA